MACVIFGCTASKDFEIFGAETLQSTKHHANERDLWAVLLYVSSLYIAKEKSKSRLILHLGKNLQSLAREGEVNATCLKPVSPPGDYAFNSSVFSHLWECKCFCYTCHLHFCSRNVDPCFCSSFSCTHLLQPEQFILFTWATFSFLLILDHFLDVPCRLVRNTTSCGRVIFSDIREKTITHNTFLQ